MKKMLSIVVLGVLVISGISVSALSINIISLYHSSNLDEYDMVIIAPSVFADAIQPLIDHKTTVGLATFLKPTEEIYEEYAGRDAAEQIKYCIKDMIETYNVAYVLLIGGRVGQLFRWHVPARYAHVDIDFMEKKILTDLYFADIYTEDGGFEDWDSDGDGVFAEWTHEGHDDRLDLIPDVALGRLPCRSRQEVSDIVQKIIRYETTAYNQSWFNNILLVGGDTNPGVGDPFPYEGEEDCEWILNYMSGFRPTRLYVSDGSLTGPDDFISAFNMGCGFAVYHGHGLHDELITFKPDSDEEVHVLHNTHIAELHNDDRVPVMVAGCCVTTNFDVGVFDFVKVVDNMRRYHNFFTFKSSCVPRCLGWNMVKQPDKGAIAYIGSSSTALGETGDKNNDGIPDGVQTGYTSGLCSEFFRLYGEGEHCLGDVFSATLTTIVQEFSGQTNLPQGHCIMEFQLLGDPSLKIGGYT